MNASPLPTVIYIAGYGRSGSTVLDLILGASDQAAAVGELFMFFRPSETRNCSCGRPVAECPFWSDVRQAYRAELDANLQAAGEDPAVGSPGDSLGLAFRRKLEGLPAVLLGWFSGGTGAVYARHEQALLRAIARSSGRHLVVDSSKTAVEVAWRPAALRRTGVRLKMIHLVRDGRAVMWSVMRGCNRKLERGEPDPRLSFPRLRAVVGWTLANFAAWWQGVRMPAGSVLRVSYEDLSRDPTGELARIGKFAGLDLGPVIARLEAHELLSPGHSISGNRLRHTGLAEVREDDEWRVKLPLAARILYWLFGGLAHVLFVRSTKTGRAARREPAGTPDATPAATPVASPPARGA